MNDINTNLWGEMASILLLCLLALREALPILIKKLRAEAEKADKETELPSERTERIKADKKALDEGGQAFFEDLARQHVIDLRQTKNDAQNKLHENEKQIKELADNVKKLESERESLKTQVDAAAVEINDLRNLLRTAITENDKTRQQQIESQGIINTLSLKVDALRSELDQAKMALEVTKTQAQSMQSQLSITQREVERLEGLLREERERNQSLSDMLKETREELQLARTALTSEQDENKILRNTIFDLRMESK